MWIPTNEDDDDNHPTDFMRPAPHPNPDQWNSDEDQLVADPLARETVTLWTDTARKNREIFTEVFRPVPSNLVRDWDAYDVSSTLVTQMIGTDSSLLV